MKTNRLIPLILMFLFVLVACGQGGEETPDALELRTPTIAISPTAEVVILWDEICPNGATKKEAEVREGIRVWCESSPAVPTVTPEPPVTPGVTVTPPPISHDLNACHHPDPENGIYHDHGTCWRELPEDSPIKTWINSRPEWQGVGLQPHSGLVENLPLEQGGKHIGYNKRYNRYETCEQSGTPGNDLCLREVYLTFHSMLTPQALRTSGGEHSASLIAVVCPQANFPASCEGGDRIIAMRDVAHYGEPHAIYKDTYCRFTNGVEYANPDHHVSQPPYWAQNLGRIPEIAPVEFISSLRNALMAAEAGRVNNLFQWTLSSRTWGYADPTTEDTCGNQDNDVMAYTSTNEGMEMKSVLWTLFVYLDEYPKIPGKAFEGFTTRIGDPAPGCTAISFDCAPVYIGADVSGNVFFNNQVRNDDFRDNRLDEWLVMDVTRPDTYAPGHEPK